MKLLAQLIKIVKTQFYSKLLKKPEKIIKNEFRSIQISINENATNKNKLK